jgi:protein TonB
VEVAFKIAADGTVHDVAVKSGPKQLASTAVDAVSEWRYKPALLNGTPTETTGSAVFVFKAN